MGGLASIENGKKGGRKKGSLASHTLKAQESKNLLIRMYTANAKPINQALINKAKEGDIGAVRELHDRVYGKSPQSVELTGKDGEELFKPDSRTVIIADEFEKKIKGAL